MSTTQPKPQPKPTAGWYPDAKMVNTMRFWDGQQWTQQTQPMSVAPPAQVRQDGGGLEVVGWLGAIFIPIVGFIIGIVLASRPGKSNGAGMIVLSIVAFIVWMFILQDAFARDPVTTYYSPNGY